jgi:hypothetical protein
MLSPGTALPSVLHLLSSLPNYGVPTGADLTSHKVTIGGENMEVKVEKGVNYNYKLTLILDNKSDKAKDFDTKNRIIKLFLKNNLHIDT